MAITIGRVIHHHEKEIAMNTNETKKSTAKRLTLTRQTLRTLTSDELRLVAGGGAAIRCSAYQSGCGSAM